MATIIDIDDLRGVDIWELAPDQIETIFRHRHMNNYVYGALLVYHQSAMPLHRPVRLKKHKVPQCLHESVDGLLDLSPSLGHEDSGSVRINYTYHAFALFSRLKQVRPDQVQEVVELLATLAYIPIVADKNDNLPLWSSPAIRSRSPELDRMFDSLEGDLDLEAFVRLPFKSGEGPFEDEVFHNPFKLLMFFVIRAVRSIIVMMENGVDPQRIFAAFQCVEQNMQRHERDHDLGNQPELRRAGNINHPGGMRYRNTLYLYSGNHLERMGRYQDAFDWYTRDIYLTNLPESMGRFYLTCLKTCERLLCALRVASPQHEIVLLRDLLECCIHRALVMSSIHARDVFRFIATHPDADLSATRLSSNDSKGVYEFAGDAARDPFLASLVYHHIVNGVPYSQIDYAKYLDF